MYAKCFSFNIKEKNEKFNDKKMFLIIDVHTRRMSNNELSGIVPSWIGDLQNTADKV